MIDDANETDLIEGQQVAALMGGMGRGFLADLDANRVAGKLVGLT